MMINNTIVNCMPLELKNHINQMKGTDVQLVIQKKLCDLDVNPKRSIFLMSKSEILANFLTEKEKLQLEDTNKGLTILLVEPSQKINVAVFLKKWRYTNGSYAFFSNWSVVLKRNESLLKEGALVQLWSFRSNSELYFAIAKVGDEQAVEHNSDSNNISSTSIKTCGDDEQEVCASRKRKDREGTCDSLAAKIPVSPIILMAGGMAHEYLTSGTICGEKPKMKYSESRKDCGKQSNV